MDQVINHQIRSRSHCTHDQKKKKHIRRRIREKEVCSYETFAVRIAFPLSLSHGIILPFRNKVSKFCLVNVYKHARWSSKDVCGFSHNEGKVEEKVKDGLK